MYVCSLKLPLFQSIGLKRLGYLIITVADSDGDNKIDAIDTIDASIATDGNAAITAMASALVLD